MPRRGQISKRDVLPDPLYGSKLVTKLINNVMYDGKKGVAQKIVYDAFAIVEAKSGQNALEVFQAALENVMPQLEVLCGKFIRFEIWTSVFWMVLVTVLLAACWIVFGATRKGAIERHYDIDHLVPFVNVVAGVCGAIMILAFFGVVGTQSYDIV